MGSPSPTRKLGATLSPGAGATIKSTGSSCLPSTAWGSPFSPSTGMLPFPAEGLGVGEGKEHCCQNLLPQPQGCLCLAGGNSPSFPAWIPRLGACEPSPH